MVITYHTNAYIEALFRSNKFKWAFLMFKKEKLATSALLPLQLIPDWLHDVDLSSSVAGDLVLYQSFISQHLDVHVSLLVVTLQSEVRADHNFSLIGIYMNKSCALLLQMQYECSFTYASQGGTNEVSHSLGHCQSIIEFYVQLVLIINILLCLCQTAMADECGPEWWWQTVFLLSVEVSAHTFR